MDIIYFKRAIRYEAKMSSSQCQTVRSVYEELKNPASHEWNATRRDFYSKLG